VAVDALTAIRAWINDNEDLTGPGQPISRGAYIEGRQPRSPAHGPYALLILEAGINPDVVAEDINPSKARVTAHLYAGTVVSAHAAALALHNAWGDLNGAPEPCGDTGITVLVADDFTAPGYIAMPATGGEQHAFTTSATFMFLAP
jgi:hypothetical protein